jgi:hypothetical protein
MITEFLAKKDFFDMKDKAIEFDSLEEIEDEQQALREIGVGIKTSQVLIHVGLLLLKNSHETSYQEFVDNTISMIKEIRTDAQ